MPTTRSSSRPEAPCPRAAEAQVIAVVIPCYRVSRFILDVLARIGPEIRRVYVVDDACPEHSGELVEARCRDKRVRVLHNARNLGVGGAVMEGYRQALADGADVIVKIDGDGQMDPALIPHFVEPVAAGHADYTKGNRFSEADLIAEMPLVRVLGNEALSLITKLSSGYWDVADPTNGLTCIKAEVAAKLPFAKISQRYFFESDMLFRLHLQGAVVRDIPMASHYGDEVSGMRLGWIVPEFLVKHARNFCKRMMHTYVMRDSASGVRSSEPIEARQHTKQ